MEENNIKRDLFQAQDLEIIINNEPINPENYTLLEFKMDFKENLHTELSLKLKIKKISLKEWYFSSKETLNSDLNFIEITVQLEKRKYFSGIIQKLLIKEYHSDEYEIELKIKSKSELLDRNKIYRVFQNSNLTYYDLFKEVLIRYKNLIKVIGLDNNQELKKTIQEGLILQYDETDWEFLVRLSSHLGMALFNTENGGITIGLSRNTSLVKNWIEEKGNLYKVFEKDRKYYEGVNLGLYICGDRIELNTQLLGFITEGNIIFKNGYFEGKYVIKPAEYKFLYQSNINIKGITLEGEIRRIPLKNAEDTAVVTIDFFKGIKKTVEKKSRDNFLYKIISGNDYSKKDDKIKRFRFPYITPYSKTKTGLFCTPEIGDTVSVIFPTSEEGEAYVLGAVNNEKSLRFSNPFIRNYNTTKEEKEKIDELNMDINEEKAHFNSMEEYVSKINEELYTLEINEGKLNLYLRDKITEKTTIRVGNTVEKLELINAKDTMLKSNKYEICVAENIEEKAKNKKEDFTNREINLTNKKERANNIEITANTHKVNLG